MHKKINKCRICGNKNLTSVLHLGTQALTGVFPRDKKKQSVPRAPLELVKCGEENGGCGLLQLRHSTTLSEMYGDNYGYRSGLNPSMVAHLEHKVADVLRFVTLNEHDLVIDIGSNDGTLLKAYPRHPQLTLVGIDPVGQKFRAFYPKHIHLIPEFFSAKAVRKAVPKAQAKVITSIAMFYDLEDPLAFVKEVASLLEKDGVWLFEQSYMPTMLEVNAYDTICHEHLEYYRLKQVVWMMERAGLKIIDVELNAANGGSFAVTVARFDSPHKEAAKKVTAILEAERKAKLQTLKPYADFRKNVERHRKELVDTVRVLRARGKTVAGWGASTKGNVLLQFCGLTNEDIPYIGEVNEDKFGAFTPGTGIPITSENEARRSADYLLVLPWHFKEHFLKKEKDYLERGGKLIFPLPTVHIV